MKMSFLPRLALLCSLLALPACSSCSRSSPDADPDGSAITRVVEGATKKSLTAFESESELAKFLKDLADAQRATRQARAKAPAASPAPPAQESKAEAAEAEAEDSVTNTQHAGVDEGGIVKLHGDYLVVLRRGRLFTIRVGDDQLKPVSTVNAFGPDMTGNGAWYDEMLLSENTIVVIGYSYRRGGTEVGLFHMDDDGKLSYRSTYHLRSNDYYSSRNYASRLIGQRLIFYTPLHLNLRGGDPYGSFPAVRKWKSGVTKADFMRIVAAKRVYRPLVPSPRLALHTVTTCDLSKAELDCEATTVMGPAGRVFYVSPTSVFVWMTHWDRKGTRSEASSFVYRMPLDGRAPTALRVAGSPIDQFSFLESDDEHLNVLVRADGRGDGMWGAEVTAGDLALLRVPLSSFGDGSDAASEERYAKLPKAAGYTLQNRFVGDYLLYGSGASWGRARQNPDAALVAYRYAGGSPAASLPLPHGVDRIEALGKNAVAVGSDGQDLYFTPIALANGPRAAPAYRREGAAQGETRSHGFFYKPTGDGEGLVGLPIVGAGRPGYRQLYSGSASMLFLNNRQLSLNEVGTLDAREGVGSNDGCVASCTDWYGNARPLFVKGRILALLGYELVEGQLDDGRMTERRRVSFAPSALQVAQ
jgi:hypothetical protein